MYKNSGRYFGLFALYLFLALPSCSAEPTNTGLKSNTNSTGGGSGGSASTRVSDAAETGGVGGSAVSYPTCEPRGRSRTCFCPDGTQTGTQLCDEQGRLRPCNGCKENSTGTNAGQLCPELQGAVGCKAESYVSNKLPSGILFVVDRSGSMMCNTPADGQTSEQCETQVERMFAGKPSKWEITIAALKESFTNLEGSGASAGLMFFSNDTLCGVNSDLKLGGVPIAPIDNAQTSLLSNALDNQTPAGGTPLVGATILAYAHLHQEAGGDCSDAPCGATGNRFVVLITDGSDSCPDPTFDNAPCSSTTIPCTKYLLDTEVPKAVRVNIRTFVIGAPGSELARGFLSQLAFEGGTGKQNGNCDHSDPNGTTGNCHFDMTNTQNFATDLSQVLVAISGKALGCEFPVPTGVDADPDNVNVQYTLPGQDPVCIQSDETVECDKAAKGWQFARNPDGAKNLSKVVLCGDSCTLVKNNPSIRVDVILGCTTIVIK
jgi:hypothetical protein